MNQSIVNLPEYSLRLHSRLMRNADALAWCVSNKSLQEKTIREFGLGLSEPYHSTKTGLTVSDALVFPLMDADGRFGSNYTYMDIPGVSTNPKADVWNSHEPATYYSKPHRGRPDVLVFENIIDLWRTHQYLVSHEHEDDYLLIASNVADRLPIDWNEDFFNLFRDIHCCPSRSGSDFSSQISNIASRIVKAVNPFVIEKDWKEYFAVTSDIADYLKLLDGADELKPGISPKAPKLKSVIAGNLYPYDPIDCNGAFHNGHLYYPASFIERETVLDDTGNPMVAECIKTALIRSDKTIQYVKDMPSAGRARKSGSVKRLTDGTLIYREPEPSSNQTWSYNSISQFLDGNITYNPLDQIIISIRDHLFASVWLPHKDDYTLMALTCITSYCMTIFESVPLVLITGEKGTGKSEFSRALIDVSANAKMIGQGSAAAIARAIDSTRGLAVLDDQDQLGGKLKNDAQSESLRQLLKQSYSKKSASKSVFDGSKDKTLNFYGIKVINNTTGIDTITGSRCLHIFTQTMPASERHQFMARNLNRLNDIELANLRDEIHSWVFSNVSSIHAAYSNIFKGTTNRTDEIHAPLRTFANLAGDSDITVSLENGLKRQISIINSPDESIDDKLSNIVHSLIYQGYRYITPTHVYLELQFRIKNHISAKVHDSDPFSPEWVGRHLRDQNLIDPTNQDRKMVRGHKLRVLKLNSDVVESVLENQDAETSVEQEMSDATGFCQFKKLNTCSGCRYSGLDCLLRK